MLIILKYCTSTRKFTALIKQKADPLQVSKIKIANELIKRKQQLKM